VKGSNHTVTLEKVACSMSLRLCYYHSPEDVDMCEA
jgi:hypothetical protein